MNTPPRQRLFTRWIPRVASKTAHADPADMGTAFAMDFVLDQARLAELHASRSARGAGARRRWFGRR